MYYSNTHCNIIRNNMTHVIKKLKRTFRIVLQAMSNHFDNKNTFTEYRGALYGKVGDEFVLLYNSADDFDQAVSTLKEARVVIAKLKRSMLAHPDCEDGSEFDDMTATAQQMEDKIDNLIKEITL